MDELAHHGVKGMHWGVTKVTNANAHPDYSSYHRTNDAAKFGARGVVRINARMIDGQTHEQARHTELVHATNRTLAIGGAMLAFHLVTLYGDTTLSSISSKAAENRASPKQKTITNDFKTAKPKANRKGVYNITSI